MVPQAASARASSANIVYVVGKDNKAEQRLVSLGADRGRPRRGARAASAEGDQVITGNLQKIGPGAPVQPLPGQ